MLVVIIVYILLTWLVCGGVCAGAGDPIWGSGDLDGGRNAGNVCGASISGRHEKDSNRTHRPGVDDSVGSASAAALEFGPSAERGRSNVSAIPEEHAGAAENGFRADHICTGGDESMLGCSAAVLSLFPGDAPAAGSRETGKRICFGRSKGGRKAEIGRQAA